MINPSTPLRASLTKPTHCYNIVSTLIQKVIRVGNSLAVTIPQNIVKEEKLKVGEAIEFDVHRVKKTKAKITPEFVKWVDKYIENNRPALEELASK